MWFFNSSKTDSLVRKLETSVLFAADFPQRKRYTHSQWAALGEAERGESGSPKLAAIKLARNFNELVHTVNKLADPKHESAVPILADLWANCALEPVRNAVGSTLRRIGTPAARSALIDLIEDADRFSVFTAVRAIFDEHQSKSFDSCAIYFSSKHLAQPGGEVIPNEILKTFEPSWFTTNGPVWIETRALAWFKEDRRWLDLCVSLRKNEQLGYAARNVLRYADAEEVNEALQKALHQETPHAVNVATRATGDLLTRYLQGQHEEVWKELREYKSIGGDLLEEANAVAKETMQRVTRNADLLAERLASHDWTALGGSLRTAPQAEDEAVVTRIEEIAGAKLPVSLRAFWEIVGGINFVWDYDSGEPPDLGGDLSMDDPLYINNPQEVVWQIEEWEYERDKVHPEIWDPISLSLAPDYLHKANISGGAAYAVILPFTGVDPIFANEEHNLPFVDYLRLCFKWGGFPRLERYPDRSSGTRSFLTAMTKDLEPF